MRKAAFLMSMVGMLLLLLVGGYSVLHGGTKTPAVGSTAPDFTLPSQDTQVVTLSQLRGQWVVLYFYPKDFTSGCTAEAHNFQRDLAEFEKRKATILGVSVQDENSHKEFCAKQGLHFKLLADTGKAVSRQYDSLINVGIAKFSARHTFLIDPNGIIRRVWSDVHVRTHSGEVLAALDQFQKTVSPAP